MIQLALHAIQLLMQSIVTGLMRVTADRRTRRAWRDILCLRIEESRGQIRYRGDNRASVDDRYTIGKAHRQGTLAQNIYQARDTFGAVENNVDRFGREQVGTLGIADTQAKQHVAFRLLPRQRLDGCTDRRSLVDGFETAFREPVLEPRLAHEKDLKHPPRRTITVAKKADFFELLSAQVL